ncbi:hypothetical protein D5086_016177 [Populus alba]|uniref:Uncharacterized protein n=1 Tax=Populus alba TaxID=43335 RepID=A0ACC4BTW3_POPAL
MMHSVPHLCSLSLSLDALLEYTGKDVEESTFELALFAESLYEMLQYQMGSRLLTFLQKPQIKFIRKRNRRKRQWGGMDVKDDKKSLGRHLKTNQPDDEKTVMEEDTSVDPIKKPKQEEESEAEEDPEEDPEGYEGKTSGDAEHEPRAGDERDKTEEAIEDKTDLKDAASGSVED